MKEQQRGKAAIGVKYLLISVLIFLIALAASTALNAILLAFDFSDGQSGVIADLISGVIATGGIGLVLFQLELSKNERARQNEIEEASFILKYNQAFIQDPNMALVETLLEDYAHYGRGEPIIDEENRQKFVNYLVYLEGLAPLILRGVLSLDHIDDLMAYRFFLAVNNPELQEKELMPFAADYRGCFKLYRQWKQYREANRLGILMDETALDRWEDFATYAAEEAQGPEPLITRQLSASDALTPAQYRELAALIYDTDDYIYPALFAGAGDPRLTGVRVLSRVLELEDDAMFACSNLFVCQRGARILGLILWKKGGLNWSAERFMACAERAGSPLLAENVEAVARQYLAENYQADGPERVSIINVCVSRSERGRGIGDALLRAFIAEHPSEPMELCVLADNAPAIALYRSHGFGKASEFRGFALGEAKPLCHSMRRPGGKQIAR